MLQAMSTCTTYLEKVEGPVWHCYIPIPYDVGQPFIAENKGRILCKVNDHPPFHTALMPKGDGSYFVNFNKERRKKFGIEIGEEIIVELSPDKSKYGLPMPVELEELLKQDVEGNEIFHSLTPGKMRSLIHIIGKPKWERTRLEKALIILNFLKKSGGELDYKLLNEAFKNNPYK